MISKSQPELYRAYMLKEKLRLIFHMKTENKEQLEEIKQNLIPGAAGHGEVE